MKVRRSLCVTGLSLICAAVLAACGTANNMNSPAASTISLQTAANTGTQQSSAQNPPYINKLKVDILTPDAKFDASPVGSAYNQIAVTSANGKTVTLDAANTPVLFEAYWCPHCQRTLVMLNKNRSKLQRMPILVSTGFAPGTSLSQAKALSDAEMKDLHIQNVQVYYLLNTQEFQKFVATFPTFVFDYHHNVEMLTGEHTVPMWEKAINQT